MHLPLRLLVSVCWPTTVSAPLRLWAGVVLLGAAWWTAWFGPRPFSEHTFFPLWFGYILAVDGLTAVRSGSSLLTRDRRRFALLFLFSIPLWWLFELANHFLGNWRYILPRPHGTLEYHLLATLAFSTVMPAIFVTAELVRTLPAFAPARRWRRIAPDRRGMMLIAAGGLMMVILSLAIPRYLFPLVWIGLFLALDPINALQGRPSIAAQVRVGRWDTVLVLSAAGLICGGLWELWNVFSMPKWVYDIPFVDGPKLFEMPLLGYGGYLPFAVEVFAFWSVSQALVLGHDKGWLRFTSARGTD